MTLLLLWLLLNNYYKSKKSVTGCLDIEKNGVTIYKI